jgi:putative flippase GtrA
MSGGTATAVNLGSLFALTHFFEVWYLYSSIAAFAVSFLVSFSLQKLWTFENTSLETVHLQATKFLTVILVALGINTILIYFFVEYIHTHYLVGQLFSGLFIAVINYFSYKHLVFSEPHTHAATLVTNRREPMSYPHVALLLVAVLLFAFLALFRLSENPPTWMDEGINVQAAANMVQSGTYAIQVAPETFVSADFLTTSFPVIFPVALSFLTFGTDIQRARIVMVLFMALLCVVAYTLISRLARGNRIIPLVSLLLLVTFAPLYGQGKNVIGEVPGLFFFLASLLCLHAAMRSRAWWLWGAAGALAGLSMATKPLYLLLIVPATLVVSVLHARRIGLTNALVCAAGAVLMLVLWFFIHVGTIDSFKEILIASNPNSASRTDLMVANAVRLVSELQPLYALGLLGLWSVSVFWRAWTRKDLSSVELFAFSFSLVNLLLFLGSQGYYRYFFPAQILSLVFLPLSLMHLPVKEPLRRYLTSAVVLLLCGLILFQTYQTFFRSWIAENRSSQRTELLSEHLGSLPESAHVFLYNVPEAAIFLSGQSYSQYVRFGEGVIRGEEQIPSLYTGDPAYVLVDRTFTGADMLSRFYVEAVRFDKYILYKKQSI